MANPSIKKGYLPIANELAERFAKTSLTGTEWRLIWVVLRQTWGWSDGGRKKDWDQIAISQFVERTTINKSDVSKTLKKLVANHILDMIPGHINKYRLNQDHEQWIAAKREARGLQPNSGLQPIEIDGLQPIEIDRLQPPHNRNKETKKEESAGTPITQQVPPFNQLGELTKLAQAESPVRRIAGQLVQGAHLIFQNQKQFNLYFTRCLRPAKQMEGYEPEQIEAAIEATWKQAEQLGFGWTPQTVVKNIARVVNGMNVPVDPAVLEARSLYTEEELRKIDGLE